MVQSVSTTCKSPLWCPVPPPWMPKAHVRESSSGHPPSCSPPPPAVQSITTRCMLGRCICKFTTKLWPFATCWTTPAVSGLAIHKMRGFCCTSCTLFSTLGAKDGNKFPICARSRNFDSEKKRKKLPSQKNREKSCQVRRPPNFHLCII